MEFKHHDPDMINYAYEEFEMDDVDVLSEEAVKEYNRIWHEIYQEWDKLLTFVNKHDVSVIRDYQQFYNFSIEENPMLERDWRFIKEAEAALFDVDGNV